jgi:regulation of enolase protein 1 (concanavalin A-like superfamily)
MHRSAALLLWALVAVAAGGLLAAPAPFPRPFRQAGPWFDGWDKPRALFGDCRFDRKGDRLTMTVRGNGHGVEARDAPRLMRDVEGDFVARVRVGGDCEQSGDYNAGLLVLDGATVVQYILYNPVAHGRPRHLLIERREGAVLVRGSLDGKSWERAVRLRRKMPRVLKVGVMVMCNSPVTIKAVFDQFKLTPLGGKTR